MIARSAAPVTPGDLGEAVGEHVGEQLVRAQRRGGRRARARRDGARDVDTGVVPAREQQRDHHGGLPVRQGVEDVGETRLLDVDEGGHDADVGQQVGDPRDELGDRGAALGETGAV